MSKFSAAWCSWIAIGQSCSAWLIGAVHHLVFCKHTLSLKLKTVFYFRTHPLVRSYMRNPGSLVDPLFGEPRDKETSISKHETTVSPKDRITTSTYILKHEFYRPQRCVRKVLSATHDNSLKEPEQNVTLWELLFFIFCSWMEEKNLQRRKSAWLQTCQRAVQQSLLVI